MGWGAAILGVLSSFPEIIKGFKALIDFLGVQFGPDWPQRLVDLKAAASSWNAAKSDKEREDAAKALAAAFNSHK